MFKTPYLKDFFDCRKVCSPVKKDVNFPGCVCGSLLGSATKHEFQAETKKLLDIVARSLYSEKEVRAC